MTPHPTRVIGIDPGSRLCGWGVVERDGARLRHVDNGVVVLTDDAPLAERLDRLWAALAAVIAEHRPSEAAIETVFTNRNARSALILGHARGVALAALAHGGLPVHEYTPQQVKKAAAGSGRADKAQVQHMITLRLDLPDAPQADAADAVAVAMCHAQHGGALPTGVQFPPRPARGGPRKAKAGLAALVRAQQQGKGKR